MHELMVFKSLFEIRFLIKSGFKYFIYFWKISGNFKLKTQIWKFENNRIGSENLASKKSKIFYEETQRDDGKSSLETKTKKPRIFA